MKVTQLAATLSIAALGALAPMSAFAQQSTTSTSGTMQSGTMNDGKTVMLSSDAKATDQYNASWVFRNLDAREVKRFRSQGFNDDTIRGAANIALRTGLSIDYVLRMFLESGMPLPGIAAQFGVPTTVINRDIPGYGAEAISVQPAGSMNNMSRPGMSPSGTMPSGSGSGTGTSGTGTTSSSSLAAPSSQTVADIAMADPRFSTLVAAVKAAGLADTLKGAGPFTIFAPTNEAFANLPAGTLDNLLKPENASQLRSILTYHVLPGRILASDVMGMTNPSSPRSVEGSALTVKTTAPVMINNANVTQTDITASNGVIHVIDTVLMPPSLSNAGNAANSAPVTTPTDPTAPETPATPAPGNP